MKTSKRSVGGNGQVGVLNSVKARVGAWGRCFWTLGGRREAGAVVEAMEGRQMMSAVPAWVDTFGSKGNGVNSNFSNNVADVATDAANNVYVVGSFRGSIDFDFGAGTTELTATYALGDAFVAKYDASGNLAWVRQFERATAVSTGPTSSQGRAVSVDGDGNVYVGGQFSETVSLNFGDGETTLATMGGSDIFLAKLTPTGGLSYIQQIGGIGDDSITQFVGVTGSAVTILGSGSKEVDLDAGASTVAVTAPSKGGVEFVASYDTTSFKLLSYAAARGTGAEGVAGLGGADMSGSTLVVSGNSLGTGELLVNGSVVKALSGPTAGSGMFVASVNMESGAVNFAQEYAATGLMSPGPVAIDAAGNVFVGLGVRGTVDLNAGAGTKTVTSGEFVMPALLGLSSAGAFRFGTSLGAKSFGEVRDLLVTADPVGGGAGRVVAVGQFQGEAQFDPAGSVGGVRTSSNPSGFVWYLKGDGTFVDAGGFYANPGGASTLSTGTADVRAVARVNGQDAYVLGGVFAGSVDFDASTGTKVIASVTDGTVADGFFGRFAHTGTADVLNEAVVAKPGVTVKGSNNISIAAGDTTPGTADGTDYGTFVLGNSPIVRTFTITNSGTGSLVLSGLTIPATGYTVLDGLATTLGVGESDTIQVSFSPGVAGTYAGNIAFTTNVEGSTAFKFAVTGKAEAAEAPELLGPTFDDGVKLKWVNALRVGAYTPGKEDYSQVYASGTIFDGEGNMYVTARFIGQIDFDPGTGVTNLSAGPSTSNVLLKYTTTGALSWAKLIQTVDASYGGVTSIAYAAGFDDEGNVLLTGFFQNSVVFGGGTASAVTLTVPEGMEEYGANGFIARYSKNGELQFAKQVTATGNGMNLFTAAVSTDGTRLAVGGTISANAEVDIDPSAGVKNVGTATVSQTVVALFDTDGNYLSHVTGRGTTKGSNLGVSDLAFDSSNHVYVSGNVTGQAAMMDVLGNQVAEIESAAAGAATGAYVMAFADLAEAAVTMWSAVFKSDAGNAYSPSVEIDPAGNAYVTFTYTGNVDLDPGIGSHVVGTGGPAASSFLALVSLDLDGKFRWGASQQYSLGAGSNLNLQGYARLYVNPLDSSDVQVIVFGRAYNNQETGAVLNFDPAQSAEGKLNLNGKYGTGYVWRMDNDGGFLSVSGFYTLKNYANNPDVVLNVGAVDAARGVLALAGYVSFGEVDLDPSDPENSVDTGTANLVGLVASYGIEGAGIPATKGAAFHVTGNGVHIEINDSTPATGDGTNFGTVAQGSAAVVKTFTVTNIGTVNLSLGKVFLPESGFTLTEGLSTTIAPGKSDTFKVTLDTSVAGKYAGEISFATNVEGESPFKFSVQGTVQLVTAPGVSVSFEGAVISDGDTSPVTEDGTVFATVNQGDVSAQRTYQVTNTGTGELKLGTLTLPSGFVLVEGLSAVLAPGAKDTFTVALKTGTSGTFAGDISVVTNVTGKNPFNFKVQGAVLPTAAHPDVMVKTSGGSEIHNGVTVFAGTNFGDTAFVGSSVVTRSFTVTNTGTETLKLSGLVLPAGYKLEDVLVSSLAAGQSDTFSISLTTPRVGTFGGDVTFKTNVVGDEVFRFEIQGTVMAHRAPGGTFTVTSKSTIVDKTFYDEVGNKVVFALTGAGTLTVEQSVSGQLLSLALSGTDIKSGLTLTVSKDAKVGTSTGITSIGHIEVAGALGSFVGGSVNVTGGFEADGAMKVLTLNNVAGASQQSVSIGGSASDKLAVTLGSVREATLKTTATLTSFKALEWLDEDETADALSAYSLGTLSVTGRNKSAALPALAGDLMADVTLTQEDFIKANPLVTSITVVGNADSDWSLGVHKLGSVTVKGNAKGEWVAAGGFGAVSIGQDAHMLLIDSGKDLGQLTIKGSVLAVVRANGNLAGMTVGGLMQYSLFEVGGKSGAINIASMEDSRVEVGGDLTSLTSKASVVRGQVDVGGNLGSVNVGSWQAGELRVDGKVNAVTVAGGVKDDALWFAGKGFGSVSIALDVMGLELETDKDVKSFKAGQVSQMRLLAEGGIGSVNVVDWKDGWVKVAKLGTLTATGRAVSKIAGDFAGDVTVTGVGVASTLNTLGSISIAGGVSGAEWEITGKAGAITVGSIRDSQITVNGDLAGFTSKGWADESLLSVSKSLGAVSLINWVGGSISAAKITSMTTKGQVGSKTVEAIAGDYSGELIASGVGLVPTTVTLGALTVSGTLRANVDVTGKAGAVTVGSADDMSISATGDIASFTSKGQVLELTLHSDGSLGAVSAINWLGGSISADKVLSITTKGQLLTKTQPEITGDFFAKVNVSGEGVSSKLAALGNVTIAGSLINSQVLVGGNVGVVSVGAMDHSVLFAGVNPAVDPTGLPTSKGQFTVLDTKTGALSTLAGFTVTGKGYGSAEATFVNSRVAAGTLTSVSLKLVDMDLTPLNGFVAGVKVGTYSRMTGIGSKDVVKIVNKTAVGVYDPAGGSGDEGYSLRIV